eukprot:scaffold131167_cov23-Tisochrysis_lutea.AAC.1
MLQGTTAALHHCCLAPLQHENNGAWHLCCCSMSLVMMLGATKQPIDPCHDAWCREAVHEAGHDAWCIPAQEPLHVLVPLFALSALHIFVPIFALSVLHVCVIMAVSNVIDTNHCESKFVSGTEEVG